MSNSNCEGPLGFAMTDAQARATETFLAKAVGPFQHIALKAGALETQHRTDISWITTEATDRYNHMVLAAGMDDTAYAANPIVTMNHNYLIPPIGRSLWRHAAQINGTRGIQAMTHYPQRPDNIPGDWPPDIAFAQICAGLLNAKSIGLIPLKIIEPRNPDYPLVVEQWALIEYACGTLPINPETIVLQINKSMTQPPATHAPPPVAVSIAQRFEAINVQQIIQKVLDKLIGRV